MSEVIALGTSFPPHLFDGEPHTIIYDPGKFIHTVTEQLRPFGSMICMRYNLTDLVDELNNSQTKQIFLVLILADQSETDVRVFLMRNLPNQDRLHSLFLIFSNGIQYHEQWINTSAMPKLKWCRSFTVQLIWDLLEVGRIACNQHISFYEQRRIQAEDNIDRNMINNARSIGTLFARKKQDYSMFLIAYFQMKDHSDEDFF